MPNGDGDSGDKEKSNYPDPMAGVARPILYFCPLPFALCLLIFRFSDDPLTLALSPKGRGNFQSHPIHPHRLGDVLDPLLAQILTLQWQLVVNLLVHNPRNTN